MNNRAAILSFMDLFSFIRLGRRLHLGQAQPTHKSATLQAQNVQSEASTSESLAFTLLGEYQTVQIQTADQLDVKALNIQVGAATLVGFAFLVQHHPAGNCSVLIPAFLHSWPLAIRLALPYVPFLVFYVFTVIFALQASRTRIYARVPDPMKLLKYRAVPENEAKSLLNNMIAHTSKQNEAVLLRKAYWMTWAVRSLLVETLALVLLLLYQTVC
jgi:hypothetical protein